MSITIIEPKPWVADQQLTASDGSTYIASGVNTAKPQCEYIVVEGPPGPDGADGIDGIDGEDGIGTDGIDGTDGADGTNGVDGIDGTDGTSPEIECTTNEDGTITITITRDGEVESEKTIDICAE